MEADALSNQQRKVLNILASGRWVSSSEFIHQHYLSQFHARIKELEEKGYTIQHSDFTDEHKYKSYKLIPKEGQLSLL